MGMIASIHGIVSLSRELSHTFDLTCRRPRGNKRSVVILCSRRVRKSPQILRFLCFVFPDRCYTPKEFFDSLGEAQKEPDSMSDKPSVPYQDSNTQPNPTLNRAARAKQTTQDEKLLRKSQPDPRLFTE